MKVIFSHDIDHLSFWEHYKDSIIPKYYVRNNIEVFKGKISFSEYGLRYLSPFHNKWQNISEIMDWNDSLGFKSNFFIGVNNGIGLSYPLNKVKKWVDLINERGFEVGVHGIDFDSLDKIKKEYDTFSGLTSEKEFGMRMHYLRQNEKTLRNLAKADYLFDSSDSGMKNPYLIDKMWEFPLQIMEGWCFYSGKRYQYNKLEEAKKEAIKLIEEAQEKELQYLNVLFHDRYYHNSFKQWKLWYEWITKYLTKDLKLEAITYKKAVQELNNCK